MGKDKSIRPQKLFPKWFYRVSGIEFTQNRDNRPEDFDEDLSELEETGEEDENETPECEECDGDDSECDCMNEESDAESERSYDGSVAEYYYELKDEREERKRELKKLRIEKERMVEFERSKETEVHAAYDAFKKARSRARKNRQTIPIDSIVGRKYKLFSADYADNYGGTSTKQVGFYQFSRESSEPNKDNQDGEKEMPVYGDIYLDWNACCHFGPFRLPTRASGKAVKLRSDGYDLRFTFFGNEYLKLSVSRDLVLESGCAASSNASEVFEFVGILRDLDKEKKEREELAERRALARSPSPRESWFERTHFMGSWNC